MKPEDFEVELRPHKGKKFVKNIGHVDVDLGQSMVMVKGEEDFVFAGFVGKEPGCNLSIVNRNLRPFAEVIRAKVEEKLGFAVKSARVSSFGENNYKLVEQKQEPEQESLADEGV